MKDEIPRSAFLMFCCDLSTAFHVDSFLARREAYVSGKDYKSTTEVLDDGYDKAGLPTVGSCCSMEQDKVRTKRISTLWKRTNRF